MFRSRSSRGLLAVAVVATLFGAGIGTGTALAHTMSPVNAVAGSRVYSGWHSEPNNWPIGPGAHQFTGDLNLYINTSYPNASYASLNYYYIRNAWASHPSGTWYEMFWIWGEHGPTQGSSAILCTTFNTSSHWLAPSWSYGGFDWWNNAMFADQYVGRNSGYQSGTCGYSPFPMFHRSWVVLQPY